jgi:hypothetical protein
VHGGSLVTGVVAGVAARGGEAVAITRLTVVGVVAVVVVAAGAVVEVVTGAGGSEVLVVVERAAKPTSTADVGGDAAAPHAAARTTVNRSPRSTQRRWPKVLNVARHLMTRNIGSPALGA